MEDKMMTREQAEDYIHGTLGISRDHLSYPLSLKSVNVILKGLNQHAPFQTITLMSSNSKAPTLQEIFQDVIDGKGGVCYGNNVFLKYLFEALGVETYFVPSCVLHGHPDNHIGVVAVDLTSPGSEHLLEAACGYPTYEAVALDFDHESPIYKSGFLTFKFIRDGPHLERLHKNVSSNEWTHFAQFLLEPKPLVYFDHAMKIIREDTFMKMYRAVRCFDQHMEAVKGEIIVSDGKIPDIRFIKLTESAVETRILTSDLEVIEEVHRLLPSHSVESIEKALKTWKEVVKFC